MSVRVYIPTSFRSLTGEQAEITAGSGDVGGLLHELRARYPEMGQRLTDERGRLLRHVNVYVNDQEIDSLQGEATPLRDGDLVAVVPAMAGGAGPVRVLGEEQVRRYHRHLIMPEVGGQGQKILLNSKVLLIGAGGLGSPAALYLAAAGVGTLGLVDFDVVDLSNLQRQILHRSSMVGQPKVESARVTLNDINPDANLVPHEFALSSENALDLFRQYDVIVDGTDNFATRYLINDAAYLSGKPLVYGSIFRFDGMATTFLPGEGCYRCLYPDPPPPGAMPNCAEAGVLGVLPGIIGTIQAIETIKLLLGIGEPLINRLLLFDALAMEFRTVKIRRDKDCPLCGDHPTVTELIDYELFCAAQVPAAVY